MPAVGTSGQRNLITASQPGPVLAGVCLGGDLKQGLGGHHGAGADLCLGVESALLPPSAFELDTMCLLLHGHLLTRAVTCSDTYLLTRKPRG